MATRVRNPKAVNKAVHKALTKLAKGKEDGKFEASIAQVTEIAADILGRDVSKTTVYRAAQTLAKAGEIQMSHEGARRNPFMFSMNGGGGTPVTEEQPVVLNFEKKLSTVVANYKLMEKERDTLRERIKALETELSAYRRSIENVDQMLSIAV